MVGYSSCFYAVIITETKQKEYHFHDFISSTSTCQTGNERKRRVDNIRAEIINSSEESSVVGRIGKRDSGGSLVSHHR